MTRKENETDSELRVRIDDVSMIKVARAAIFRVLGVRNPHAVKVYMMQGNKRIDLGDLQEAVEFVPSFGPIEPIQVLGRLDVVEIHDKQK